TASARPPPCPTARLRSGTSIPQTFATASEVFRGGSDGIFPLTRTPPSIIATADGEDVGCAAARVRPVSSPASTLALFGDLHAAVTKTRRAQVRLRAGFAMRIMFGGDRPGPIVRWIAEDLVGRTATSTLSTFYPLRRLVTCRQN